MVRLAVYTLVLGSVVLTGCQKTRVGSAPPKPAPAPQQAVVQTGPPPGQGAPPPPPPPNYGQPTPPPPPPASAPPSYGTPAPPPPPPPPTTSGPPTYGTPPPLNTAPPPTTSGPTPSTPSRPGLPPTYTNTPANPNPQTGTPPQYAPPQSVQPVSQVAPVPTQLPPPAPQTAQQPNAGGSFQVIQPEPPRRSEVAPIPQQQQRQPQPQVKPIPQQRAEVKPPVKQPESPKEFQWPQKLDFMPKPRPDTLGKPMCGNEVCQPVQVENRECGPVKLATRENVDEAKLDVLFVVDTSASLRGGKVKGKDGELAVIAAQVQHYLNAFPEKTDIQIAVMLGHGTGPHVGKLFQSKGSPAVLKTSEIRNNRNIADQLRRKMEAIPNESGGAQGEALMYSLYKGIQGADAGKGHGFFRKDAYLNVVFVTDEQDVCWDYGSEKNWVGKIKKDKKGNVIDDNVRDKVEADFFTNVCAKTFPAQAGQPVDAAGQVYEALRKLKGDESKLILAAIGYTDTYVKERGHEDENERASGIIELVRLNGATRPIVNLKDVADGPGRFEPELKFLGEMMKQNIASKNESLTCATGDLHAMAVNYETLVADVMSNGQVIASYDKSNGLRSEVNINKNNKLRFKAYFPREDLDKVLDGHKAKDATVNFRFQTRNDIDPKTGQAVNPETGERVAGGEASKPASKKVAVKKKK